MDNNYYNILIKDFFACVVFKNGTATVKSKKYVKELKKFVLPR